MGETGTPSFGIDSYGSIVASGDGPGENTHPKAFVNILLFDKDHNFLDIAFEQIDGEQTGTTVKAPHDSMTREVTVKEVGYAYVYISNENHSFVEVYFACPPKPGRRRDDVTITHTPSKVIQYNACPPKLQRRREYYPFGLQTSNSWTREDHNNNFLYNQGSELNKTSGWYETMFRNYDPAIGRFTAIDPLATSYAAYSGYHYSGNNPMMISDPTGASYDPMYGYSEGCACTAEWNEFSFSDYRAHMDWINSDMYATIQFYEHQGFNTSNWKSQRQAAYHVKSADLLRRAREGDMNAVREYGAMNGDLKTVGFHYLYRETLDGKYVPGSFSLGKLEYGIQAQQGDPNIYQEISNSFNENQLDYMLAENVGLNAMFNMIGHYSVRQIDGKYYFNASAAGNTTAESQGDVTFRGSASLIVNGKQVSQTPFVYKDGYNVKYPDGFSNLGGLSLQLPTSGTVMINLQFSYHIVFGSAGERHSTTMTVPVYIRTIGLPRN